MDYSEVVIALTHAEKYINLKPDKQARSSMQRPKQEN